MTCQLRKNALQRIYMFNKHVTLHIDHIENATYMLLQMTKKIKSEIYCHTEVSN
jgi:hypothetical protein